MSMARVAVSQMLQPRVQRGSLKAGKAGIMAVCPPFELNPLSGERLVEIRVGSGLTKGLRVVLSLCCLQNAHIVPQAASVRDRSPFPSGRIDSCGNSLFYWKRSSFFSFPRTPAVNDPT